MRVYADTSFLISLYGADEHSPAARETLRRLESVLLLTDLQRFEFENALRLLRFRKLYTPRQGAAMGEAFLADEVQGFFSAVTADWPLVLRQARDCSARFTASGGHRAMDILHVAVALGMEAELFLTFDTRQRALARSAGLKLG